MVLACSRVVSTPLLAHNTYFTFSLDEFVEHNLRESGMAESHDISRFMLAVNIKQGNRIFLGFGVNVNRFLIYANFFFYCIIVLFPGHIIIVAENLYASSSRYLKDQGSKSFMRVERHYE